MALHWIFGSSGSGKTHYLYNHIIRLSKEEPSGKYLIIVPEAVHNADSERYCNVK